MGASQKGNMYIPFTNFYGDGYPMRRERNGNKYFSCVLVLDHLGALCAIVPILDSERTLHFGSCAPSARPALLFPLLDRIPSRAHALPTNAAMPALYSQMRPNAQKFGFGYCKHFHLGNHKL